MLTKNNPEKIANGLLRQNFPIHKYEAIQEARKRRLKFWQERNIQPLLDNEKDLIEFGEQVLNIMRRNRN